MCTVRLYYDTVVGRSFFLTELKMCVLFFQIYLNKMGWIRIRNSENPKPDPDLQHCKPQIKHALWFFVKYPNFCFMFYHWNFAYVNFTLLMWTPPQPQGEGRGSQCVSSPAGRRVSNSFCISSWTVSYFSWILKNDRPGYFLELFSC